MEPKEKVPAVLTLDRVADLSETDRESIRRLSQAVYPPQPLADRPGRNIEWSTPAWCIRLRSEEGTLLSYVGVYLREAECDGLPLRIGGIGNVKTHPSARGQGLAALGIRSAVEFFRTQPDIGFAMLVCEPHLRGYYARLGWREFDGRLLVLQHGAPSEFTFNRVMTHQIRVEAPAAGTIDLQGPPW